MPLLLRRWRPADGSQLRAAAQSTPDLRLQLGEADLSTVARAREFIFEVLTPLSHRHDWVIEDDGRILGNVGISAVDRQHATGWVSYWLRGDARGRGNAMRALATVTEWAWAHDLHRLELGHRVDNVPSCRVATHTGCRAEGIEREKLQYDGERFDVELHARLRTDPVPSGIEPIRMASED